MLLQTLFAIASMTALTGAILLASLASAKASLHRTVATKAHLALVDATADFLSWARAAVRANGAAYDWRVSAPAAPIFESLCATGAAVCPFAATIAWNVTGASTRNIQGGASPESQARNLAQSVDEQRISATLDVTITDTSGRTVYGGATREVTARVFDSEPYVAITATKDASSLAGGVVRSEGDTAGAASSDATYDTRIHTTIDCSNTPAFDQAAPLAAQDGAQPYLDATIRPYGSLAWAYETPCVPLYDVAQPSPDTPNYSPPQGATYHIEPGATSEQWRKGDQNAGAFPP